MSNREPQAAITIDIDWAPDYMIRKTAELLLAANVRATWFVTHATPELERLRSAPDLFELGVHPNFLPRSTHGDTPEEVLAHCGDLVPDARAIRTHSLVQSTPLLDLVISETDLIVDVSLFLPHARGLAPVEHFSSRGSLVRLPYMWEDDLEMARPRPVWAPDPFLVAEPGLKIFDFHPVHVYLNTEQIQRYSALKEISSDFRCLDRRAADRAINTGPGTRRMFERLIGRLAALGGGARISDLIVDANHT